MKFLKSDTQSLLNFINHDLLINKSIDEKIMRETNLISSGVIDSLSLIQLVTHLEKQNAIEIQDADVNPENFESVDSIIKFLNKIDA
jgi:acyl carrier protein